MEYETITMGEATADRYVTHGLSNGEQADAFAEDLRGVGVTRIIVRPDHSGRLVIDMTAKDINGVRFVRRAVERLSVSAQVNA